MMQTKYLAISIATTTLLWVSGCSDPFASQVDQSRVIFKGKVFDEFVSRSGMTVKEAEELVGSFIKASKLVHVPAGPCVIVDRQFFFPVEESTKLGSLDLRGYYVDPGTKRVRFVESARVFYR